jgi:hypothetical protein
VSLVSKKLRNSARGQDCQVRIPGICNFNPETTILAHVGKSGIGQKPNDYEATFCCSSCHDAIDYRVKTDFTRDELENMANDGMRRTWAIWVQSGLIKVAA